LIPNAVDEILRWEPPIHHFRRTATADTEVGGQKVADGDKVIMWYDASNRDPALFDDPHTFRVDRTPNSHLSFGIGEHFCLGANLARLSLRLLLEELVATVTDIEVLAPPRRLHSNLINGVKELPVGYSLR
ncbi:MAG: cytochrome P450, partial [Acidimicrobiales bacterium]